MRPNVAHAVHHPRFRAGPIASLPAEFHEPIALYVVSGSVLPPYLRAVAAGDLYQAAQLNPLGPTNRLARFFLDMPDRSRGSWARVVEWEMIGGLKGIEHLNNSIRRVYP